MSGIGDYVHLRGVHYRYYGIRKTEGQTGNNLFSVLNDQHEYLMSLIKEGAVTKDKLDYISRYYSNLYYGNFLNTKISPTEESVINKDTEETLYSTIATIINNNNNSSWTSEQVKESLQKPSNALIENSSFTSTKLNAASTVNTLHKAIDSLNAALLKTRELFQTRSVNGKISLQTAELGEKELNGQIKYLIRKLQQVIKDSGKHGKQQIKYSSVDFNQPKTGYMKDTNIPDFKSLLLYIQDVLRLYQGSGVYLIAGESSEIASVLKMAYQDLVNNEINITSNSLLKAFDKRSNTSWLGPQSEIKTSSVKLGGLLYTDMIVGELSNLDSFGSWSVQGNKYALQYIPKSNGGADGTVDVILDASTDPELSSAFGAANNFNISLKNYSSIQSHGITLVQKTPLMSLLLTGNFLSDFVNHYMNLMAINNNGHINLYSELERGYSEAQNYIYWGAAIRGFSGFMRNNELLVINSRAEKRIYVQSAYAFNKKLEEKSKNIRELINIKKEGNLPLNANEKIGTTPSYVSAGTRISKFFIDLNKIKLTVSLKPGTIKNGFHSTNL